MFFIITAGFVILILNTFIVKKVVYHAKVKSASGSISIVHISDIHGRTAFLNGRVIKKINQIDPDIVFIMGDLVSNQRKIHKVINELGNI